MTKKRFIKLLMSKGEQRNEAQKIAARFNARKYDYQTAYSDYFIKTQILAAFSKLGRAASEATIKLKELGETIKNVSNQIHNTDCTNQQKE